MSLLRLVFPSHAFLITGLVTTVACTAPLPSTGVTSGAVASSPKMKKNPPPAATRPSLETAAQAEDAKHILKGPDGGTAGPPPSGQVGRLVLKADTPTNPQFTQYVTGIGQSQVLVDAIALFNGTFTFPNDVPVVTKECGEVNAFYDPSAHAVSMCYELMDALAGLSPVTDATDPDGQWTTLAQEIAFATLHESGHAFIGENHIPLLGREEDIVDEISGVLFVAAKESDIPLLGTEGLVQLDQGAATNFADVHSFSEQRYFDMLCLIYGSDPNANADLIGDEPNGLLPQDRAANCPHEWDQKSGALQQLASQFVRQ